MEENYEVSVEEQEGVNESEPAEQTTPEVESEQTDVQNDGAVEPEPQSAEENARYAAMRRRAEQEARLRYERELSELNQQVSAMCQGITHPVTGQPITNVRDYMDALSIQQKQAREQELKEKGIDPSMLDRMIESNPVVMQAQRVIEHSHQMEAQAALQNDMAELTKYDPNIKGIKDLAALPNFPQMVDFVAQNRGSIVDAYKLYNFDALMQNTNQAARQQAINQMRGKDHLTSPSTGVAQSEEYVEVPADIMARFKAEGKTEKQIRDLYKTVAGKLHI